METKDRHREGYYKEYAERTGKKDRHSTDYSRNTENTRSWRKKHLHLQFHLPRQIRKPTRKQRRRRKTGVPIIGNTTRNILRDLTEVSQKDMSMEMLVMEQ